MKTTKLLIKASLLFVGLFSLTSINAQCTRSGSFIQSDPGYSISGTGNITFETNGDKNVFFETDFATVQGADLRVYLSKTDDINTLGSDAIEVTTSQLINDDGGTGGAGTSPITGLMSFPIPSAVQLDEFNYIVIQCIVIDERWGYSALGANNGASCGTILSVNENLLNEKISFYPNPVNEILHLNNNTSKKVNVKIYSILGNLIFEKILVDITNSIDLSDFKTGTYFANFSTDNSRTTKKIIKF